ncbi:MAG: teichoic acid biosynthesis protein [Deltaproteobacteria bacterium]|nr:teichoic acid biosynthesis protein [Deltaproteobacteria bacterium]MBN2671339.1 teichoic acid biosynthesis protein [Deltaproteobacteria bacterium]
MRILYGVVGEGMGHAIRSRVTIDELLRQGHEIKIMASSRASEFLSKRYGDDVKRIHGLHLIYEENRVRRGKTLWTNVQSGVTGVPKNIAAYFERIDGFKPEVVISDFESWTYLYGVTHRLPVISIDNMQIINRCTLPPDIIEDAADDFRVSKAFVKGKLPFCDHYLITTFFTPDIRKDKTTLVPPILRPEILHLTPETGDHLLVYQTGEGYDELADILQQTGMECRVYGMRRHITEEQVEGNLIYRPFSEDGFVEDLRTARGVIASGGFTLMGEAVYLHKPMLSVPLHKQFEQMLNARYLQKEGFGLTASSLNSPEPIQQFISRLPEFQNNLSRYTQAGNNVTFGNLTELLDRAGAGLL